MTSNSQFLDEVRVPRGLISDSNRDTYVRGSTPICGYVKVAIDDLQNSDSQSSRALYNTKQRESEIIALP